MTHQKSDGRVVPEGQGNLPRTRGVSGGGKASAVKEQTLRQLQLFATAVTSRKHREDAAGDTMDHSMSSSSVAPKAENTRMKAESVSMESLVERLETAFQKVAANRGAPGPDRETIAMVREHLGSVLRTLGANLLSGNYQPGDIRRVWIPKAGGGERGLGIPNVVDRVVQEATRATLEPLFEPTFHPSSHGFRPDRSCQTAIAEARGYVDEGYQYVVDIDLKNFFNEVNRQRLMSRLAERVTDRRILVIIKRMLAAKVVMPDGVRVSTEEGVPQGGPLSPLLSNIVLSELDEELTQRGHRFVRYADDCNIYVRSERAGQRVMASVTSFLKTRLRLEVNASKSAVALPDTRHFLGYRLVPHKGEKTEILLSERSVGRLREKVVELTPRKGGVALQETIERVNAYLNGWLGHFRICTSGIERFIHNTDAHIRRRLRAIQFKLWKTKRTAAKRLIRLGASRKTAWRSVYGGRKSLWALSACSAAHSGLRNAHFAARGLVSLEQRFSAIWADMHAPGCQLTLALGYERP